MRYAYWIYLAAALVALLALGATASAEPAPASGPNPPPTVTPSFTGTPPTATTTPALDLYPGWSWSPPDCYGGLTFWLSTLVYPPDAYVPVTTTMSFSSMFGGRQDFLVPPHQGNYTVACTTGPCHA